MFDIGWTELLLIGVVALIVVGPKDLPGMFRTLGRVTGRLRSMAREFQRAMDQAADESGVNDAANAMKYATSPRQLGLDQLKNSAKDFRQSLRDEYQEQADLNKEKANSESDESASNDESETVIKSSKAQDTLPSDSEDSLTPSVQPRKTVDEDVPK